MMKPEFIAQMQSLLGGESAVLFAALEREAVTAVRYNSAKPCIPRSWTAEPVSWSANAYYVRQRPAFTLDPAMHAGGYYVQEASSMLIGHIAAHLCSEPALVLDLCAAPGGKTTLLADALPPKSVVVANETIRKRNPILAENVIKWGNSNVLVCENDAKDFSLLPPTFDLMLVDAPCSGEGLFRKDKKAQTLWNADLVQMCAARQRRIVASAWNALKEGGYLIYSTCTFNVYENERNLQWFASELGAECVDIPMPYEWNITPSAMLACGGTDGVFGYRCFPHRVEGEGFFVGVLKKYGTNESAPFGASGKRIPRSTENTDIAKRWLKDGGEGFVFEEYDNGVYAATEAAYRTEQKLREHLCFVLAGRRIADIRTTKLTPTIQLALSADFCGSAFPSRELDLRSAIAYLSHSVLPTGKGRGLELMRYEGMPLGFANDTGTRCNNLFPSGWRIRNSALQSLTAID